MRNSKKQEANLYRERATDAAREALWAAGEAERLLELDLKHSPSVQRSSLEAAAARAIEAAEAAEAAALDINLERHKSTKKWDGILLAQELARDAAAEARRLAATLKSWLGQPA